MTRAGPTTDEISDVRWLLGEIDRIPGCERTKAEVRRILGTLAGRKVYISLAATTKAAEVDLAVTMLDSGRTVAQTRDALMATIQARRSKAYKLIGLALNARRP